MPYRNTPIGAFLANIERTRMPWYWRAWRRVLCSIGIHRGLRWNVRRSWDLHTMVTYRCRCGFEREEHAADECQCGGHMGW